MFPAQTDEQIQSDISEIVGGLIAPTESSPTTEVQIRPPTGGPSSGFQLSGFIIYLFLAVLVVGLGLLIFQVLRNFRSTRSSRRSSPRGAKSRRRKRAGTTPAAKPPPVEKTARTGDPRIPLDVQEWLRLAAQAYSSGDYREAVRCRYRAVVSLLAHRDLVIEDETTTAGEYVVSVNASMPSQTRSFATAAQIFETAWYSERPIESDRAQEMVELFDELQVGTR
ncbi:MAG: DUF4129 domain-containing protein [Acidimicrobiales bacterium]